MNEQQQQELHRLRRLLGGMYQVAEQASLTGAFGGGVAEVVSRYNLILARLGTLGVDTYGLFPPLPDDTGFDRVGVACKLLSSYLYDYDEMARGPKVVINNASGLPDLEQLKDIGRIVRENMAEAFAQRPTPPQAASAPPEDAPTQPRQ